MATTLSVKALTKWTQLSKFTWQVKLVWTILLVTFHRKVTHLDQVMAPRANWHSGGLKYDQRVNVE